MWTFAKQKRYDDFNNFMKIYLIRHGESLANLGLASADFSMDNQNSLSKKVKTRYEQLYQPSRIIILCGFFLHR